MGRSPCRTNLNRNMQFSSTHRRNQSLKIWCWWVAQFRLWRDAKLSLSHRDNNWSLCSTALPRLQVINYNINTVIKQCYTTMWPHTDHRCRLPVFKWHCDTYTSRHQKYRSTRRYTSTHWSFAFASWYRYYLSYIWPISTTELKSVLQYWFSVFVLQFVRPTDTLLTDNSREIVACVMSHCAVYKLYTRLFRSYLIRCTPLTRVKSL